jgi:hypothetical protein
MATQIIIYILTLNLAGGADAQRTGNENAGLDRIFIYR